jgi:uncharacterized protein YceK
MLSTLGRFTPMKLSLTLVALAALLTTGCGTICNQIDVNYPGQPYGGVRYDIDTALYEKGSAYLFFLDVPVSAVFDTLMLPFDLSQPRRQ